jgi:hypothetical protein
LYQRLLASFYNTAEWMRNQPDAQAGPPQMPAQAGTFTPQVRQKLHQITEQYGVPNE